MSNTRKRKRTTGMVERFLFLSGDQDVEATCKRASTLAKKFTPSVAKSWNQCGKGFQAVSSMEGSKSMGEEKTVVRSLTSVLHSDRADPGSQSSEEIAEITWSSSDSDLSGGELLMNNSRCLKERRSVLKGQSTENSYHKYICMINSLADSQSSEEDIPAIDWDSLSDKDATSDEIECLVDPNCIDSDTSSSHNGGNRNYVIQQSESLMTAEDILEFSSDNESTKEREWCTKSIPSTSASPPIPNCGSEHGRTMRSASNWLRSAQAFLQTPDKQKRKQFKTPEDSAKKRKKFMRGGLAERLNRLQCRERSAINFWKHQSLADLQTHTGRQDDILMVKVLDLHEECSMFIALCQPLRGTSTDHAIENDACSSKTPLKVLFTSETALHLGICAGDSVHIYPPWLCFLVQDMYGLFGEVHHHTFCSLEEDMQIQSACWEGKECYLTGMKVLQRTTRGRSLGLFSLIDSLWPPLISPKVHGQSQGSQESIDLITDVQLPAPSFCYVLAPLPGEGGIKVLQNENVSDLYRPSASHNLKHILQHVPEQHRCSFSAEVIYTRFQDQTAYHQKSKDFWLFVIDSSLQSAGHDSGVPKTLSVYVTSSCILGLEVIKSLNDETSSNIFFKDAIIEKGFIVCAEGTILSVNKLVLQSDENERISSLTGNIVLNELNALTKVNSLCTVQGNVVGVDEANAFSWIACNRCGNGKLEKKHGESESFYCCLCAQSVMTPFTKMQLEVFLQYPDLPHSTIKIKLLEPSISSLLLHSSSDEGGYEVDGVLGQELGPLSCYVRSVTHQPASWIGLEEVSLLYTQ
ncbi:DNA repair-scaffolding protein isoform X5 [Chiloscyllium plagiosum]|uniref:DNA repair-scaffolding protein isoform X5 n=1 Tax=Chiloscyllium plagiosum TaxID=36176 RepID=UPI001CB88A44|nr:DNA repair-scaffolding protein isoform X5 [Chiloscyllium plagiosum]